MSSNSPAPDDGAARLALPSALSETVRVLWQHHPGIVLYLVAEVNGQQAVRLPIAPPPVAALFKEDTNADRVLQALDEAERPLTVVDLGFRANGGQPTGALREALRKLVKAGHVRELPGPPRQYERT